VDPKKIYNSALIIITFAFVLDFCCCQRAHGQNAEQKVFTQSSEQKKTDQPAAGQAANSQASADTAGINKTLTSAAPILEIKRLESEKPLYSIELREVQLTDLFRVIAHDYNLNILMDKSVSGTITASFTNISLEEALDAIAELSNLSIEKRGNIIKVSPNLITRTVVLKYIEAKKFMDASSPAQGAAGASQSTGILGLLSEKGKILVGQQQNSLTVIDYPDNVRRIDDYLKVVDHKMETRVYKLKYLKADEVVGATVKTSTTTQATTATGTQLSTTTSTSTASGAITKGQ
jgi:type II secretory pathway component GspD/PulD (secretin)